MSGVAFTIGLDTNREAAVKAYFDKFSVLPPRGLNVASTTHLRGVTCFETLVRAVADSQADRFAIVVHGHEDGSGLFLALARRDRAPAGARTTHDKLRRLRAIAGRRPQRIEPRDRETLQLRDAEIQRLLELMETVQEKSIRAIEFRGCNLGRNRESVTQFRGFFGTTSFGAPDLHSFFGRNPVGTGAGIMRGHAGSHQGATHTYTQTFGDKRCHCCIGVDTRDKPVNGHIVADDSGTLDRWIQANFQANSTRGRGRQLAIHGLWKLPTVDLSDPDPTAGLFDRPRPIFPLQSDGQGHNEYAQHIVYSP